MEKAVTHRGSTIFIFLRTLPNFTRHAIKTPTGHAISLAPECSARQFNLPRNDKKLPKQIVIRKDQQAYQRESAIA